MSVGNELREQQVGRDRRALLADHRNYYKVEQWSQDGMRVERMLFAGYSLDRARRYSRPSFAADRAAATPSASAPGCLISGRSELPDSGAAKCVAHLTAIVWNQRETMSLPIGISGERFMRNTLFFLSLMAGLAIASASSASATPINAAAVKEVATTASQVQPARWRRYRRYGWGWGYTKCYREFVIGPYSCHWFPL